MQLMVGHGIHPDLRELVAEASMALSRLDANRLEELAQCCRALNRGLPELSTESLRDVQTQARAAAIQVQVFGRVLDATRANLDVLNRVRERRSTELEYRLREGATQGSSSPEDKCNGHD